MASMSSSQFTALLEQQKKSLEAAKTRKGQKATNKESRAQLEFNFFRLAQGAAKKEEGYWLRTTQINYAYPPSVIALASLKPITISELRLETRHVGRVLIVRSFAEPVRLQSVMNAIEDQNLDVDPVAVYNKDPNASPADILPKGAIFAIKESYYKAAASGGYVVRVDQPSDIFQLDSSHALIPLALAPRLVEIHTEALKFKDAGNTAYKKRSYSAAVEDYTRGLAACTEQDKTLRHDLRRNRSICYLYLGRYEFAAKDAIKALYSENDADEKRLKANVKALYRAGRAFYHLQDSSKAESRLQHLLQLAPNDKDGQEQLQKAKARLAEATTGNYNFIFMRNSISPSRKRLDHASFTANVAVRSAGEKGRGLFAIKDLKAGELILAEEAFSVAFESETGNATHMIMNLNTNTIRTGPHALLYYDLVQKTSDNPSQAKRFLQLHDGGYTPKFTAQIVDGVTVIDTFQVVTIMEHNCFGCANTTTADEVGPKQATHKFPGSVGLWLQASYINHSCMANSHRSFIGDFMIVRATKDICKDEEIFLSYRLPELDYVETQKELKNWNFTCSCAACVACVAEAQTSNADRKGRQALIKQLSSFLKNHEDHSKHALDKVAFAKAKDIYNKLDATYDKATFVNIPRLPLIRLSSWMSTALYFAKPDQDALQAAERVLRDCGYAINANGQSLEIDSTYCFSDGTDVDAAICAAKACFALGRVALGHQYVTFARERDLILHGATKISMSAEE